MRFFEKRRGSARGDDCGAADGGEAEAAAGGLGEERAPARGRVLLGVPLRAQVLREGRQPRLEGRAWGTAPSARGGNAGRRPRTLDGAERRPVAAPGLREPPEVRLGHVADVEVEAEGVQQLRRPVADAPPEAAAPADAAPAAEVRV